MGLCLGKELQLQNTIIFQPSQQQILKGVLHMLEYRPLLHAFSAIRHISLALMLVY
jgi:hypothetical protein